MKNKIAVAAVAKIYGGNSYPNLNGVASFTQMRKGVLVTVKVNNLPKNGVCNDGIFAIHIHEGENCTGDANDQFSNAKTHYNPLNCLHPYHAGDLPPLIGNDGFAYMSVLTDRFAVNEIIDKVIVIHENKDDFTTQPSGNSGTKIGCGRIVVVKTKIKY